MRIRNQFLVVLLLVVALTVSSIAQDQPDGVLGMTHVNASSCLSIWVPLESDQALDGLTWYNNDGTVVFPEVLAGCGLEESPGSLGFMTPVALNVSGATAGWSEVTFDMPVASAGDGLYITLKFPFGSSQDDVGAGGGAGVGYSVGEGGYEAWMSYEGVEWIQVHSSLNLAVAPRIVAAEAGTLRLVRSAAKSAAVDGAVPEAPLRTALLNPTPNPFNPETSIAFTLAKAQRIELDVIDLRGRQVRTLAQGRYSAGAHVLEWTGVDEAGRRVASGVYLARLRSDTGDLVRKMLLVK